MFLSYRNYKVGDQVVFRKSKKSDAPSPNAINLWAEPSGESYRYTIKKYWTVIQVEGDRVQVITRRGKRHWLSRKDSLLRKASWVERWLREEKFPLIDLNDLERSLKREEERERVEGDLVPQQEESRENTGA
jgi:hypothetical protein